MVAWRTFCAARWRLAKWLSCQLLASYLSQQGCDQLSYMVKQLSEQLPYQLLYGRQLAGGRSPVVWPEVWSEMLVLCTVTRVQTKEKTATRARKHREDNQRSSRTIGDV